MKVNFSNFMLPSIFTIVLCVFSLLFSGCKKKEEPLIIEKTTFRAIPGARAGAAFLTITNKNEKPVFLQGATFELAGRVEIHDHIIEKNGVAKMVTIHALEIPAAQKNAPGVVELKRGGKHLMLFDLDPKIFDVKELKGTLNFSFGPPVQVVFTKDK